MPKPLTIYTCKLDPLNPTRTNFPDEFGVINAVFSRFLINVLEYREQYSGNNHPKNQVFCHIIQGFIPQWLVKYVDRAPVAVGEEGSSRPNSNEHRKYCT